jgi:hypothetical protein
LECLQSHRLAGALALALAVLSVAAGVALHPHFAQSLATPLSQLTVVAKAPGARAIRGYWDDAARYPDSYVSIPVVQQDVQQIWEVRLEALSEPRPAARHNQLWVLSIRTPEQTVSWSEIALVGNWVVELDPWQTGMDGKLGRTDGGAPNSLSVTVRGSRLAIVLAQHPWSGRARVTVNGVSQVLDLYSASWRTSEFTFLPEAPPDYGMRTYGAVIKQPRGQWNRITFAPEPEAPLEIERVLVDGMELVPIGTDTFERGALRWPAGRAAALVTVIVVLLLVSTVVSGVVLYATDPRSSEPGVRWTEHIAATSFAASMSLVLTTLFYPGIFNDDAIHRWHYATLLLHQGAPLAAIDTWHPPLMTFLMVTLHRVSGEFGLPTFVQALCFYYCLGLLALELLGRRAAVVLTPLIALIPTVALHAVLLSSDTGTAIALMACAVLLYRRRGRDRLKGELPFVLLFLVVCVALFGFRHNSPTVLPALGLAILVLFRSRAVRLGYLGAALAAVIIVQSTPAVLGARALPVSAAFLVWEHIGMLKHLNDEHMTARYSLDQIGDTRRAIRAYQERSPDNLLFGSHASFPGRVVVDHSGEVKAAFWRLARDHPEAFFANRRRIFAWTLGLRDHLYGIDWVEPTGSRWPWPWVADASAKAGPGPYGFYYLRDPDGAAVQLQELNARFADLPAVGLLFRPWCLGLASLVLGGIAAWMGVPALGIGLVTALAMSYYSGFFVLTSPSAFRYYFPAYVLLQLAVIACLVGLARAVRVRDQRAIH